MFTYGFCTSEISLVDQIHQFVNNMVISINQSRLGLFSQELTTLHNLYLLSRCYFILITTQLANNHN